MTWIDRTLLEHVWSAVGGHEELPDQVSFSGARVLSSTYPVADLASAVVGAAGLALAEFAAAGGDAAKVRVDRRLSGAWFGPTFRSSGWEQPPTWDAIAGDYRCADGWIRLHTNDFRHRQAALAVLGVPDTAVRPASRDAVAGTVSGWPGEKLEAAVVAAGGCAAQLRSSEEWRNHHQGMAVAHDPLLSRVFTDIASPPTGPGPVDRPLRGLKVLDLTRVLAGPAATRFLAGFGAQVLRIDPLDRTESALEVEMTIGKHCARLDLREHRQTVLDLLADADLLIHGYRPGAMDRLGLGERELHAARPGLVEVMLDAYGWAGPWRGRRGFDSLVQMSSGIAHPMSSDPDAPPIPLPVQALDHATGYLAATAGLRGLSERYRTGLGSVSRVSLARTGILLQDFKSDRDEGPIEEVDLSGAQTEDTFWGPGRRLPGPVTVGGTKMSFSVAAAPIGSAPAAWA
ncbi:crotonobetainyl-CoA:carnitine CoA-transferase CaiB-like acyl-CoA transferase [Nakamurella sp. UYEF19]|uniref:CoA transferase n=1 Tax=Nakamurella sp. UYEF19 TaxID=1756392 RepID=UPI00339ACC2B